ncbi:MAG: BBP7 family outer membrane beta-barrel protein [Planctomycetaceae bacterium]|nr:BBP7 family outer membrane beta-barrel protein [Planctomycetaceae bacterium]
MLTRRHLGLLLLAACLLAAPVQAQDWSGSGYPQYGSAPSGPPGAMMYGPPPGYAYSAPCPSGTCPPGDCPPNLVTELVPDTCDSFHNILYDTDSRLDLFLRDAVKGSWARLEYLNWSISGPQAVPLGASSLAYVIDPTAIDLVAPVNTVIDPTRPFEILAADDTAILFAKVPVLQGISLDHLDGIRGSFGIPLGRSAWVEGSAWGLRQASSFGDTDALPFTNPSTGTLNGLQQPFGYLGQEPIRVLATSLTTNGNVGDRFLIYDEEFSVINRTDVWSGEINLVFDLGTTHTGLSLHPLVGYRHLQFTDELEFGGTYSNISDLDSGAGPVAGAQRASIFSRASNHQDGVHLGLRTEYASRYVTLGVEPKVGFNTNRTSAQVTTGNLRTAFLDRVVQTDPINNPVDPVLRVGSLNDPVTTTTSSRTEFSPTFDLGVYAKVHVCEWMNLKVGYNLLWLGNLSTAENNIRYNDDGDRSNVDANTPGVVVRQNQLTDRVIDGFTIGGEILLP